MSTARQARPVLLFFDLDEVVSPDHLLPEIDGVLDLDWVHKELAAYYSHTGSEYAKGNVRLTRTDLSQIG